MTTTSLRRTCPVHKTCSWRGPIVRESRDDDARGLERHLAAAHADVDPSTLWETWERVDYDPADLLRGIVLLSGFVLAALVGLHLVGVL